ncbi:MAG: hypothetical protein WCO86_10980 [Planctomycetota bacterium]
MAPQFGYELTRRRWQFVVISRRASVYASVHGLRFQNNVRLSPLPPSPSPRTHPGWCEVMAKVEGDDGCSTPPSVEPELSPP